MFTETKIIKGKYLDSVKLKFLTQKVQEFNGVQDAVVTLAAHEIINVNSSVNGSVIFLPPEIAFFRVGDLWKANRNES